MAPESYEPAIVDPVALSRFRRADAIFDAALDVGFDKRAPFVRRACAGDAELATDVERLLRAHDRMHDFMSQPPARIVEPLRNAASDETLEVPLPACIGEYRIKRELGAGGVGVVYLAERVEAAAHAGTSKVVALKVLHGGTYTSGSPLRRFLSERQILASLEHPHIAHLLGAGVAQDGTPYFAMAYCAGGSLAERLERRGRLPVDDALRIAGELAAALSAAHGAGVYHRDMKPANVLFDNDDRVQLTDFGAAGFQSERSLQSGSVIGTAAYLAPEQVNGTRCDHRADLWSLGVTLYEMLAGSRPFNGNSYAAVLHAVLSAMPAPFAGELDVPANVEQFVRQLLDKNPAARPQSATDVERIITDLRMGVAPVRPARSHRNRIAALVAVGIATIGLAAMATARDSVQRDDTPPRTLKAPNGAAASEAYTKGQFFLKRPNAENLPLAIAYFQRALSVDSTFAPVYAGLANAFALSAIFGDTEPAPLIAQARSAAQHALRLDASLGAAHTALAHILFAYDWHWAEAEREFVHAIALNANDDFAHRWYGLLLNDQGRFVEAETELARAIAIDPLNPGSHQILGRIYVNAHRPDDAIRKLNEALELNPELPVAHEQLAHAYLQKGMWSAALAAQHKAAANGSVDDTAQLAYVLARVGDTRQAHAIVNGIAASGTRRYLPPVGMAMAHTALGDVDAAFAWLERGRVQHALLMDMINVSPAFESLHHDQRWRVLVAKLGLVRD